MAEAIPKVAAIHDLSGFGRASLTVVLPVLSAMGIHPCPLQTAMLSTQTSGYDNYYMKDLTGSMERVLDHWESLGLRFEGIYSGFLGSPRQVEIVSRCIDILQSPEGCRVLIDPVLGDDGQLYGPFDRSMVAAMRTLVRRADIITPNYTEALLLLDESWHQRAGEKQVGDYLKRLAGTGPATVIMTSVPLAGKEGISTTALYARNTDAAWLIEMPELPGRYPGTGDLFASVLIGALLREMGELQAVRLAAGFVCRAIAATIEAGTPIREGVVIEPVLPDLMRACCMEERDELPAPALTVRELG